MGLNTKCACGEVGTYAGMSKLTERTYQVAYECKKCGSKWGEKASYEDILAIRPKDPPPKPDPKMVIDWTKLEEQFGATREALVVVGFRRWNDPDLPSDDDPEVFRTHELWLIPANRFGGIPKGLMVTNIFGDTKAFDPASHSRDERHGVLSFGILLPRQMFVVKEKTPDPWASVSEAKLDTLKN